MRLRAALGTVEHVGLDVVEDIEPSAAGRVADGLAVGAGGALLLDHGRCSRAVCQNALSRCAGAVRTVDCGERKGDGDRGEELLEGHVRFG